MVSGMSYLDSALSLPLSTKTSQLRHLPYAACFLCLVLTACSGGGGGGTTDQGSNAGGDGGGDSANGGANAGTNAGANAGSGNNGSTEGGGNAPTDAPFDVLPVELQTIDVDQGTSMPVVEFTASQGGRPVSAAFSVDRGDAATIAAGPAVSATFQPTGRVGGLVTVTAGYQGSTIERQVLIRLRATQNGATGGQTAQIADDIGELTSGGGVGGVGGEGLGSAVSDAAASAALDAPTSDGTAEGLRLLYPYEGTVWPRGLPAPLLMWQWSNSDADAVRVELETSSGSYRWSGTFGRPAILTQTGGAFVRHPIPQDVWDTATQTAGGSTPTGAPDRVTVKLTVVKDGVAAGPIRQTWTIAPARLSGTIYYNSYGTQLAKNSADSAVGGDKKFGGAVLSIRVGDTGPVLAAGATGNESQCRVCHSVSANGSRLIASYNGGSNAASYALSPTGIAQTGLTVSTSFPGIYPDGSFALTTGGKILEMPAAASAITPAGLADVATRIGTPMFDPAGKLVAFNPMAGPSLTDPTKKLVVMDFAPATRTFSNARTVVDNSALPAAQRPGWPAFLPDGESLVFHQQSKAGGDGNADGALFTRKGAKAQIHWTSTTDASQVTTLNALNGLDPQGVSYLPKLDAPFSLTCTADGQSVGGIEADHADDANLNYEPTVNPVASGGYAWIVFASRRMYGSVATIPPFCSDPRGVDLITNITPKKLWVAAIDLSAKPGADASHPAFYLPAQELLAGNSRGFWVLDPCRDDGQSCESGDQCCNGFCTANASDGALQCGNMPPDTGCSAQGDKCTLDSDCCEATNRCVGGFCSLSVIVQ